MAGIVSYGGYIPRYRLSRDVITAAMKWLGPPAAPGEKAMANFDEDAITMAVASCLNCLNGLERESVDGLYFATTTPIYAMRQNAGIMRAALDLNQATRTADFTDTGKAGTSAFLSACDLVKGGGAKNVLISASDYRPSKIGGPGDYLYGDGAAAFLIGEGAEIATIGGSYSLSYDFIDRRQLSGEKFEHVWEERWIRDAGYGKFIPEVISGLIKKYNLNLKDFTKVIYPCPYAREHTSLGKGAGIDPAQIQDPMLATIGDTGTAQPLLMLAAAMDEAKPGDKIMVIGFGSGADAFFIQITPEIEKVRAGRKSVKKQIEAKKDFKNYEQYLAFRNLTPVDTGLRAEQTPSTAISLHWRLNKEIMGLVGSRCLKCGTPQYPVQRICVNPDCGATDQMEDYRFSDKNGVIYAYTGDVLTSSFNPPSIYGGIDFEGGGRYFFDFTDCDLAALKVGMPMKMTFRRKYLDEARGVVGYCWKAIPVTG